MGVLDTFSLAGKVSVVTGANRGIGRALAGALAEAGSDVVLLVRDAALAEPVVAELQQLGVRAEAVVADVTRSGGGRARPSTRSSRPTAGSTCWSTTPASASTVRRWR